MLVSSAFPRAQPGQMPSTESSTCHSCPHLYQRWATLIPIALFLSDNFLKQYTYKTLFTKVLKKYTLKYVRGLSEISTHNSYILSMLVMTLSHL